MLSFNIARSIRIMNAKRARSAAAARMAAAELELAACYGPDGECMEGAGLRALAALAESGRAGRALSVASLQLTELLDGPSYATREMLWILGVPVSH